jgi:hypothetical protein
MNELGAVAMSRVLSQGVGMSDYTSLGSDRSERRPSGRLKAAAAMEYVAAHYSGKSWHIAG